MADVPVDPHGMPWNSGRTVGPTWRPLDLLVSSFASKLVFLKKLTCNNPPFKFQIVPKSPKYTK
jgi:hypothetical protein